MNRAVWHSLLCQKLSVECPCAGWDLGFGINFGSRCFHRSRECSLAHPKPTQLQRASRLGLVVPMKKLLHSCKYSTGANRTILSEVQLQLPVKEGTSNYNILFFFFGIEDISAHLQVYYFMQLKDPGTWYKMRNAFVCSQNATTDPPAR